ncbi:MAG: hypothetical protein U0168_13285 [Nannocystaceae bacterium]
MPLWFRGELVGAIYVDHRLRRDGFVEGATWARSRSSPSSRRWPSRTRGCWPRSARAGGPARGAARPALGALLEAREVEVVGLRQRVADSDPGGAPAAVGSSAAMRRVYKLV